jgi:hypothetical protein
MHKTAYRFWTFFRLILLVIVSLVPVFQTGAVDVRAQSNEPPGPDRFSSINVVYTEYKWWLFEWEQNEFICEINIEHDGWPTPDDIYNVCGEGAYEKWTTQPPCPEQVIKTNSWECKGFYLQFAGSTTKEREMTVTLPPAVVWVSLEGCEYDPTRATNECGKEGVLVLTGDEPLSGESITRIEGTLDSVPFSCEGAVCRVELKSQVDYPLPLNFWAYSSYGDSSVIYEAQVRILPVDPENTNLPFHYVDVLSDQWIGPAIASCSDVWQTFPPAGGVPVWLSTPRDASQLNSNIPYTYLAANLIRQGVVDASQCSDSGLMPGGTSASQCGEEAAREAVIDWQNRYDSLILKTAKDTGIPAQLLKNLFARESQFWPGLYPDIKEAGLGQLTEDGADTALAWNPAFYEQFCPLMLSWDTCKKGYLHLGEKEQAMLRGAMIRSVNASCDGCAAGLDLSQVDYSVNIFAHTLLANCAQTGQVITNITGAPPGEMVKYEDLWKFTLVNYNAGPGCLGDAIDASFVTGDLTWDNLKANLNGACSGAVDYVEDITKKK